jgi:hypothetical protein
MKIPNLLQAEVCQDEEEARIRGSYKTQGTYQSSRKPLNDTRGGREEIIPRGTVYRKVPLTGVVDPREIISKEAIGQDLFLNQSDAAERLGISRELFTELERFGALRGEVSEQKRRKHGVVINGNENN